MLVKCWDFNNMRGIVTIKQHLYG